MSTCRITLDRSQRGCARVSLVFSNFCFSNFFFQTFFFFRRGREKETKLTSTSLSFSFLLFSLGGRAVLQAISVPDARYDAYRNSSDFIREHIFPGGHLVSMGSMASAARPFGLAVTAATDVGPDYACTLREWRSAWEKLPVKKELISQLGYPASFWRKYRFYFAYCEAGFDARYILNYQVAFTKVEEEGETEKGGNVGGNNGANVKALSSSSSSSALSSSSSPLLLALLSWLGGALAVFAATGSSLAGAARLLAGLGSLLAAGASAAVVAWGARGGGGAPVPAAAAAAILPPPASLAPLRVADGGKLDVAAAEAAELVAVEE